MGAPSYTSGAHWWNGTSGNFEKEASGDGDESQNDQPVHETVSEGVAEPAVEHIADLEDVGGAAEAVEKREAVGENAGAERAEEQIFHGRFVGALIGAQKSGENVEAEGHGLQAEEEHDQVDAGGHEHHADAGEENQRVVFAFLLAFEFEVTNGKKNDESGGGEEQNGEDEKKPSTMTVSWKPSIPGGPLGSLRKTS